MRFQSKIHISPSRSSVVIASDYITEGRGFKSHLGLGFFVELKSFLHLIKFILVTVFEEVLK